MVGFYFICAFHPWFWSLDKNDRWNKASNTPGFIPTFKRSLYFRSRLVNFFLRFSDHKTRIIILYQDPSNGEEVWIHGVVSWAIFKSWLSNLEGASNVTWPKSSAFINENCEKNFYTILMMSSLYQYSCIVSQCFNYNKCITFSISVIRRKAKGATKKPNHTKETKPRVQRW